MAKRKTTVQILKDARAILARDGWCRWTRTNWDGAHCMMGALGLAGRGCAGKANSAAAEERQLSPVLRVVTSTLGLAATNNSDRVVAICKWNNDESRTKRQVLAAFSRAIKAEEAKKARATP